MAKLRNEIYLYAVSMESRINTRTIQVSNLKLVRMSRISVVHFYFASYKTD